VFSVGGASFQTENKVKIIDEERFLLRRYGDLTNYHVTTLHAIRPVMPGGKVFLNRDLPTSYFLLRSSFPNLGEISVKTFKSE
jgi:hypothetical protein